MKSNIFPLFVCLLALVATGCKTTLSPDRPGPKPPANDRQTLSEASQLLRVRVTSSPKTSEAQDFARHLGNGLEGALAAAGYRAVYEGEAEIHASLLVGCEKTNARGTQEVYQGDADAVVVRAPEFNAVTGQKLADLEAKTRFDAVGKPGRGRDAAVKNLADAMRDAIAPWLMQSCAKAADNASVTELTVSRSWLQFAPEYPGAFVGKVSEIEGVYSCLIQKTDPSYKQFTVKIVYDRAKFPEGLLNRLYAIKELKLSR